MTIDISGAKKPSVGGKQVTTSKSVLKELSTVKIKKNTLNSSNLNNL